MDVLSIFVVAIIIAVIWIGAKHYILRGEKAAAAQYVRFAFETAPQAPTLASCELESLINELVASVAGSTKSSLVGGGSARTSAIGEALFVLTFAAKSKRGNEGQAINNALLHLAYSCSLGTGPSRMKPMDHEIHRHALLQCKQWADSNKGEPEAAPGIA